ncbi:MAG: hypothetical protein DRN47_03715 [Candidatus Wolframiiraptor sp.]|nr:MAG: hypothetical protein DRN47_03715 [Candidatus Wolframiiraptor sp.]
MMKNYVKEKISRGEPSFGAWITIGHPDIAEIMGLMGFDFLLIDMEHSPIDYWMLQHIVQAISSASTSCIPMVRVPGTDYIAIKRALDVGIYGLVVPHVDTKRDAITVVNAAKYPPKGMRGFGPRRACKYGLEILEYTRRANDEIMVVVQIETREAVKNVEDILSVDGVDMYFIGPWDLATTLGHYCQIDHPEVVDAINRIIDAGKALGVPGGIVSDVESVAKHLQMGFKFMTIGADSDYIMRGCKLALNTVKECLRRVK